MKLGRVTGSVTATAKDARLGGLPLLICDIVDGKGKVLSAAEVAVDTVGAGPGDQVLIAMGSAARLPVQTTGAPVDAVITAIVDQVTLA
jgi:ethanolamine utilization protein EutN